MQRRAEGAELQRVGLRDVDSDLKADEGCRQVPDGACDEGIEVAALATEAEVEEIKAAETRSDRWPSSRWAAGRVALADRASVVNPERARLGGWLDRCVGANRAELDDSVGGEPELKALWVSPGRRHARSRQSAA